MNKRFLLLLTLTFCIIIPKNTLAFTDTKGHWAEETINAANEFRNYSGLL